MQLCAERRAAPRSGFAFVGRVSEDARADCKYVRSERAWRCRRLGSLLTDAAQVCERVFVRDHRYIVVEYDLERSWLLVGQPRRLTVELEDTESFDAWAAGRWPPPQYKANLEPEALGPWRDSG